MTVFDGSRDSLARFSKIASRCVNYTSGKKEAEEAAAQR
jgi:hypothetical protein